MICDSKRDTYPLMKAWKRMKYSLTERTFINTEIFRHGKQLSVSYLLLTLTGLITWQLFIGYFLLMLVVLWLIVDAFLIFKKVDSINSQLEQSLKRYVNQLAAKQDQQ